jgi:hypothetical protein
LDGGEQSPGGGIVPGLLALAPPLLDQLPERLIEQQQGASKNPKARNLLYGIECDSEKLRDFIGTRHEAARFFRFFRAAEEAAEDAGFS